MFFSIIDLESIVPIDVGRVNSSYVLNFKDSKSILRVSSEKSQIHIIDRVFEQEITIQASKKQLAPKIIAMGTNFIVSEYYENNNMLDTKSSIEMIMPSLSSLHILISGLSNAPVFEEVLKERMLRLRACNVNVSKEYWTLEDAVIKIISSPEYLALPKVLCHLDLTPRNILFGAAGVRFIDFEMANLGPKLLDLASLSVGYGLNDEQEKELVAQYFDSSSLTLEVFYKCKLCYHFRCILWLLLQQQIEVDKNLLEADFNDLKLDIDKSFACMAIIDFLKKKK